MEINVKNVEANDLAPLAALVDGIAEFSAEEKKIALELIEDSIHRSAFSGYATLVAVQGQNGTRQVIGYLCYGQTPMTAHTYDLYWIGVAPAYRSQGVARLLYHAFERIIKEKGGQVIRVETSSTQFYKAAKHFYSAIGFCDAGCIPNFYHPGENLNILFKEIQP